MCVTRLARVYCQAVFADRASCGYQSTVGEEPGVVILRPKPDFVSLFPANKGTKSPARSSIN